MSDSIGVPGHNQRRPLRRWRYAMRKQTFHEVGDGTCRVTCDDGREGLFEANGRYISGSLTQASKELIIFVTDPLLPPECNYRWNQVPVDINRPSGWPEDVEKLIGYHLG